MVRWSAALLSLLLLTLAGCVQDTADPDGAGEPMDADAEGGSSDPVDNSTPEDVLADPDGTLIPVSLDATGCDAVALLAVDDYDAIDDFLPAGFIPADVATLLRVQDAVYVNQGAMGPVAIRCAAHSLSDGPLSLVLPGTFVYTPDVAGIDRSWVDAYDPFVAVDDPQVADLFEAFGWEVERGLDVAIDIRFDEDVHEETGESMIPGISGAQVTASQDGAALFVGAVVASPTYHTREASDSPPIRFWHDAPGGLSYLEAALDQNGRGGAVTCSFSGRYAEVFQRSECGPGSSLGLVIPDFDLRTTLVRLHGIHA